MNFISVVDAESSTLMLINLSHVTVVERRVNPKNERLDLGCTIYFTHRGPMKVKESWRDIATALEKQICK